MNKEELLKNISGLLKKNEEFLNGNPEIFHAIEDRLFKAIDYEDWEGEEDQDDEGDYEGGYGDDLFDQVPDEDYGDIEDSEELDDADRWLAENDAAAGREADVDSDDIDAAGPVETEEPAVQQEPKAEAKQKKSSRYLDWKARDKYEDHHQAAIEQHMKDGYSHREAERLAGAHESPTDFYSALKHTVNPSEPSPKMLEQMKQLAHGWLQNANRQQDASADASMNPVKHASGKMLQSHEDAHGDFSSAYNEFLGSDELKGLRGRDRHNAIKQWKAQYHEANPEYRDRATSSASASKVHNEANEARAKRREEGMQAILDAGKSGGDLAGGYSAEAAGGVESGMSAQHAAQMVGGEKGESGYSANIKKDPAAVFAERNPEYIKHLRGKLEGKLSPEQSQRMAGIDSFKNKGDK